jgi:tetratricopeptide (TPR) repeat protein
VAANPKEPNVHFGLGYLLWTKGQYPEAAQEFQAELANDPRHMQAMLYLADAKVQMNQKQDALPILEKLVAMNPGSSMGHMDLGIVYVDGGENEKALGEFQMAARLAPGDANAHWHMGRLYHSMGKDAEAKLEFSKVKTLNKAASNHLVKLMSKMPEPEDATPAQK